jgi:phage tail sheath protein FI
MPTYLSPGVYVEEVASGSRPIEGVGTSVAAFVGLAPRGALNAPTLVTNWSQYVAARSPAPRARSRSRSPTSRRARATRGARPGTASGSW